MGEQAGQVGLRKQVHKQPDWGGGGCLGRKGDSHHPSPANVGILQPTVARSSFFIFSQEAKTPDFYVKYLDF